MRWGMLLLVLVLGTPAAAEGVRTLRIATVAPEGTAWAHEMTAWTREIESATNGAVKLKMYFGGIAGGELDVLERIKRHQLDGAISGGMICSRLGPSPAGAARDRAAAGSA